MNNNDINLLVDYQRRLERRKVKSKKNRGYLEPKTIILIKIYKLNPRGKVFVGYFDYDGVEYDNTFPRDIDSYNRFRPLMRDARIFYEEDLNNGSIGKICAELENYWKKTDNITKHEWKIVRYREEENGL